MCELKTLYNVFGVEHVQQVDLWVQDAEQQYLMLHMTHVHLVSSIEGL